MSLEFGSGSPAESRELLIRYDDGYPQERFRRLLRRAPTLADTVVEPWEEGEFFLRLEKFPGVPCPAWFRFHHGPE